MVFADVVKQFFFFSNRLIREFSMRIAQSFFLNFYLILFCFFCIVKLEYEINEEIIVAVGLIIFVLYGHLSTNTLLSNFLSFTKNEISNRFNTLLVDSFLVVKVLINYYEGNIKFWNLYYRLFLRFEYLSFFLFFRNFNFSFFNSVLFSEYVKYKLLFVLNMYVNLCLNVFISFRSFIFFSWLKVQHGALMNLRNGKHKMVTANV